MRRTAAHKSIIGLAVGTIALLCIAADPDYIEADGAQYLSVAAHIARGEGVQSNLIYYEQQYAFQRIPAPQTVFPPGYPSLIAATALTGAGPAWSAWLPSFVAFLVVAIILFRMLDFVSRSAWLTLIITSVWLLLPSNWYNILIGNSETVFTAMTIVSAYLLVLGTEKKSYRFWALFASGVFAGFAVFIRYQGVFLLVPMGFFLLFVGPHSVFQIVRAMLITFVFPLFLSAVLLGRNAVLTGALTGGPLATMRDSLSISNLIELYYWELSKILGVSFNGLRSGGVAELVLVIACVLGAFLLGQTSKKRGAKIEATLLAPLSSPPVIFSAMYVIFSMASLSWLATTASPGYIQARYLLTLAPFGLVVLIAILEAIRPLLVPMPQWVHPVALALMGTAFLAAQVNALEYHWDLLDERSRVREIRRVLQEPINGTTVLSFIQSLPEYEPVFASQAQLLGMAIDRPTLGATPSRFTARNWDHSEVLHVMSRYGVRYIVFFPTLFDPNAEENANRHLFVHLKRHSYPDWLEPILIGESVQVYGML